MIIVSKQSFECVNPSTGEKFVCRSKDIVTPPDWVANDRYFRALCDDDLITCHMDSKSVDTHLAAEEATTNKKDKKSK